MKRRVFIKKLESVTGRVEAIQNLVDHVEPPFVGGLELEGIYDALSAAKKKLMVALELVNGLLSLSQSKSE